MFELFFTEFLKWSQNCKSKMMSKEIKVACCLNIIRLLLIPCLPDCYVNPFFFFSFCYSWNEWKNAWGIEKLVQIQECLFKNSNRHQALFHDVALVHQWERLGVMFIVAHVQSHVAWTPNHSAPFPSCFSHQARK